MKRCCDLNAYSTRNNCNNYIYVDNIPNCQDSILSKLISMHNNLTEDTNDDFKSQMKIYSDTI